MAKLARSPADDPTWPWIVAGFAGVLTALYLVFFFAWAVGGTTSTLTRWHLLLLLLSPDDVLANALAGDPWRGLFDRGTTWLAAAAFLWSACWIGWWPLEWLQPTNQRPAWERAVMATALGLHFLSLLTLLVGLLGWLRTPVLAIFMGAAGIVLPLVAWRWLLLRKKTADEPQAADDVSQWLHTAGAVAAVLFAAIILLGAALPPWDFDVLEYHLQVPKEWYQAGRIEFLPHNLYANMPLGGEMFPLAAMSILGDWWLGAIVGKTVMGACALLTAAVIYGIARRMVSPPAAIVASLIWLSHPWAVHVSISGLNEQVYALYLACAVGAVAWSQATIKDWLLAGIFAGAAAACKYPAVVMAVMPLAAWAFLWPPSEPTAKSRFRMRWAALGGFVLASALSGGAWYARNAVQSGNPVYPLLANVLDGRTRTPEKNEQFARGHAVPPYAPGKLLESAMRILWQSEHQSPLLIPLVLLGLAATWRMSKVQVPMTNSFSLVIGTWSLVVFFLASWWLFTHRLDRFLVPAIPLAAVVAGIGVEYALRQPLKWAIYPLLAIGLLYNLVYISSPMPLAMVLAGDNRWLVPLETLRAGEPSELIPITRINADVRWLNAHVPAGQRVLCVGEAAVFDLQVPVYYHTCFDDCLLVDWMTGKTAAERRQLLHDQQVGFVHVDWAEIERYRTPGNYGFDPRFSRALIDELVEQQVLGRPLANAPPDIYPVLSP